MLGLAQLAGRAATSASAHARARSSSAASSGSCATSNWPQARLARADQLALAAQLEVDLGEAEAVGVLGQRAQPRRAGRPHQQAASRGARRARRARAAGAAGRSRSARRSRPASPSRWARRCRPRSRSSRRARRPRPQANAAIACLLLARAHAAVQQHQPVAAQLALAQALELGRRRAQLADRRRRATGASPGARRLLLDQRADDERLAPGAAAARAARRRRARARARRRRCACRSAGARAGSSRSALASRSP